MESDHLSSKLVKEYKGIFNTRKRVEKIYDNSDIFLAKRDLDSFYEGMFLKSVTLFESFIEELFIGLLYDKYRLKSRKKVQKQIFSSRKLVLNYLLNGKNYLDLLPFEKLKKTTNIFFKKDNPFFSINETQKNILRDVFIVRNAIAHSSFASNQKFQNLIRRNYSNLPEISRSPSGLLQSLNNDRQTVFEVYIMELNSISYSISNFT